MQEWIYYIGSEETPEDFVPQEGSEDISLNKAMRIMLVGGHQLH